MLRRGVSVQYTAKEAHNYAAYTSVETIHSIPTNVGLMHSSPPCHIFTSSGSHRVDGLIADLDMGGGGGAVASIACVRSASEMSSP